MATNTNEIGRTGLQQFSGRIQADFLREFHGIEAYKRLNEMRLNSPIIGGLLNAIRMPILSMDWTPASTEGEEDVRLEILRAAIDNMSYGWNDHVAEALLFVPFGYYPFEIVYERGENGWLLWRKFSPRGQDTITRWQFSDDGGIEGFYQRVNFTEEKFIPIDKTVLYRINVERNNPEGRSILRTAWTSYYYAKYISQSEAIGIERGMDGFPVITLPEGASTDEDDSNSDAAKAAEFVRNIRNDEQAGMVLPNGWALDLLAPGAQSRLDADKVIRRYEARILMSSLAQFLNLGQEGVGSLALSSDQTDFFTMSVNAVADVIADTVTKYAIPRLLKLNGYDAAGLSLTHTPANQEDVTKISGFLASVGDYLNWSAEDEVWLRQVARLPERSIEDIQGEMGEKAAAKKAMAEAFKRATDKQPDETNPDEQPKEKYAARFAASAPDEAKRRKIEREMQKKLTAYLEKQRRRIVKAAKETRNGYGYYEVTGEKQGNLITRLQSKVDALTKNAGTPNVYVTMPPIHLTAAQPVQPTGKDEMIINIHNPTNVEMTHKDTLDSLKALTEKMIAMKATVDNPQPAPQVTFSPVIQPADVVNQNNITVQPAPVENKISVSPAPVENNITVQPADVVVERGRRIAEVNRDKSGKVINIIADDAD
jgi:hypothetical protein